MQFHTLQPKTYRKKKKIIGRGGKRGTYSGRGVKGQLARSGHKLRPELRDILKKIPKKRGYRFPSLEIKPAVVNLDTLEKYFSDGETVSPATLLAKGLVHRAKGALPKVKILGRGACAKKLAFEGCAMSASVAKKIHG